MEDSGVCRKCARMKATCTFGEFLDGNDMAPRSSPPANSRQEYHERRASTSSSHSQRSFEGYSAPRHPSHPSAISGSTLQIPSHDSQEYYGDNGRHYEGMLEHLPRSFEVRRIFSVSLSFFPSWELIPGQSHTRSKATLAFI